jgi:Tol biopolymer transport system component
VRVVVAGVLAALVCAASAAEELVADLRQGTNISVTLAPAADALVTDLVGQLWRVPLSGGAAESLTPPGENVRNPRYSPDGQYIVYQRLEGGQWDLWLLELASREARRLTDTPFSERDPDFRHDGTGVVFVSDQTGHACLWSLSLDGTVLTQLTEEPGDASLPTVSDRGALAYVLDRPGSSELRVLTAAGAGMTVHSSTSALGSPSWRPGGDVLVFSEKDAVGGNRLRMLLLASPRVLKTLTEGEDLFRARPVWPSPSEFIYAADGQIWRRGLAVPGRRPVHLFAAHAVETRPSPLHTEPLEAAGPHRALGINDVHRTADGRRAIFTALGDLWLSERGSPRRLTDDRFAEIDPVLAPDERSVVLASDRTGQLELWRVGLDDRRATQLTFGAINPHRPAISPDGTWIAFLETDDLNPGAATRLRLLDTRGSDEPTTLAVNVLGDATPAWTDDSTVALPAAVASRPERAHPQIRLEIGVPPAAGPPVLDVTLDWQPAAAQDEPYVVQIGRLFDGVHPDYRRHVDLHVEGGRIKAIVGRGVLPLPAKVFDASEATVIPGLIDVHVHQSELAGEALGRAWLAFGVTTVREIASDLGEAIERGEAWASGRRLGPRLVVSAAENVAVDAAPSRSTIVPAGPYPGIANGFAHSIPEQGRLLHVPQLAARPLGLAPAAGSRYELEVSPSYSSYQDGLGTLLTSGTVLAPALAAWRTRVAAPLGSTTPRGSALGALAGVHLQPSPLSEPASTALTTLRDTVARLVRTGGRVALGSDAPAVPYGLGAHWELSELAAAGITNDQVLRLATAEGALALGLEQQVGTLEEGKLADFVVIDGDPLQRLDDTRNVRAVVKGGLWLDRSELLAVP